MNALADIPFSGWLVILIFLAAGIVAIFEGLDFLRLWIVGPCVGLCRWITGRRRTARTARENADLERLQEEARK